jgi:hypothetical protein
VRLPLKEARKRLADYGVKASLEHGDKAAGDFDCLKGNFDFLTEFGPPVGMNAFDQFTGLLLDLEALLGRKVDVVDWNAARNPFFRRLAERTAKDVCEA